MGVLPDPAASAFTAADLMQAVSKYRGFYTDVPAAAAEAVILRDDAFSLIWLDVFSRIFPTPDGNAFTSADLIHWVGKFRGFYADAAAAAAPAAGEGIFIPTIRRRRR